MKLSRRNFLCTVAAVPVVAVASPLVTAKAPKILIHRGNVYPSTVLKDSRAKALYPGLQTWYNEEPPGRDYAKAFAQSMRQTQEDIMVKIFNKEFEQL